MNEFWNKNKSGIISGIVASAMFLYFFQPLLEMVSKVFIQLSGIIGTAYVDRIYAQAAHLETQDFSFTTFILYFGSLALATFLISLKIIQKSISPNASAGANKDVKKADTPNPSSIKRFIIGSFLLCLSLFLFSLIAADFTQLSTISSFKQHMRIIAPYIDNQ